MFSGYRIQIHRDPSWPRLFLLCWCYIQICVIDASTYCDIRQTAPGPILPRLLFYTSGQKEGYTFSNPGGVWQRIRSSMVSPSEERLHGNERTPHIPVLSFRGGSEEVPSRFFSYFAESKTKCWAVLLVAILIDCGTATLMKVAQKEGSVDKLIISYVGYFVRWVRLWVEGNPYWGSHS